MRLTNPNLRLRSDVLARFRLAVVSTRVKKERKDWEFGNLRPAARHRLCSIPQVE